MIKKYLIPAIIIAVICVGWELTIAYFDIYKEPSAVVLIKMLVAFLLLFFTVKMYKTNEMNNAITFGEAFQYGAYVSLIAAAIGGIIYLIAFKTNETHMMSWYNTAIKIQLDSVADKTGEIPSGSADMIAKLANPYVLSAQMFFGVAVRGVVFSLISAAILRTKNKE